MIKEDALQYSAWLYKHPWITCLKKQAKHINDPRNLRINAMISSEVRDLWSHPCTRNWVAIRPVVVYYAQAASAFSTGIIC